MKIHYGYQLHFGVFKIYGKVHSIILLLFTTCHVLCTECPLNRPFAYYGGRYCCLYSKEKPAYEYRGGYQDEYCDGSDISLESKCCFQDEYIRCNGVSCETPSFNTSEPCPEDYPYPYYYGLYCCQYAVEKDTFDIRSHGYACQGNNLTINSLCCYKDIHVNCKNPPCSESSYWSLSWYAEGNDDPNDINFSRKFRVPDGRGIVIGRGYDLKNRMGPIIELHLQNAGFSNADAHLISFGEQKEGETAQEWISNNNLESYVITHTQQWELFKILLNELIDTAKDTFTRSTVVDSYGSADFDTRHSSIKGLVIDLLITNDYTTSTMTFLQPHIVANDVTGLKDIMSDSTKWPNVSLDRFNRRKAYMESAAASIS